MKVIPNNVGKEAALIYYERYWYNHSITRALCLSMTYGVCVQGMLNAQVWGQVTETQRLKVNSRCHTA